MTNKKDVRQAFDEINKAIIELESARAKIVDLHEVISEVENSTETLNRISHIYEPSNDAHEAVFARVKKAENKLREFDSNKNRDEIIKSLGSAYNSTNEAYRKII